MIILLLILLPVFELYLFVAIGSEIGALTTVLWTVVGAFIGWVVVKYQGFSTLASCYSAMQSGENPATALADQFMITLGGVLLFIPGFFTDFIGILCFLPLFRRFLLKRIQQKVASGAARVHVRSQFSGSNPPNPPPKKDTKGSVIEGEYRRK